MDTFRNIFEKTEKRSAGIVAVILAILMFSSAARALDFTVVDSFNWRAGQTDVSSVTENYSYNESTDTLTVTATFNKSSSLAPLPPMMAYVSPSRTARLKSTSTGRFARLL